MSMSRRTFGALALCTAMAACSGGGNPHLEGLDVGHLPDQAGGDPGLPDPGTPPQDTPAPDTADLPATGLLVLDPEAIDFGMVAEGITLTRPLRIGNGGTDQLLLRSVALVDNPDSEFALGTALPGEIALVPGQFLEIQVSATNLLGGAGTFRARIRVVSNDPGRPEAFVYLLASRAGEPSCSFEVTGWTGEMLSLGDIPAGSEQEVTLEVVHTGTAPVSFQRVDLLACSAGEPAVCGSQQGDPQWIQGSFAGDPQPTLQPGGQVPIQLLLRGTGGAPGTLLRARLQLLWTCASDSTLRVWPDDCPAEGACPPNLSARIRDALVTASPSEVRFEAVPTGCSATREVRLSLVGTDPIVVSGVRVDPSCNQEGVFTVQQPGMPATLSPDAPLTISVTFAPLSESLSRCHLDVLNASGEARLVQVPLSGTGVAPETQVDSFTQGTQDPDILLVVDSSGTMLDDLDSLKKAFASWLQTYVSDGRKARLGLIGLSVDPQCPRVGALQGPPRLLTAADADAFGTLVDQMAGDWACDPSAGEAGLEASRRALSSPLVDDLGVACSGDQACPPPYRCYDGFCGGANRGFLRPRSPLDVVIFSDEDDSSPAAVETYVRFLQDLKGFGNQARSRFDVVVGDAPGGCDQGGATAEPGTRYIQAAAATGGAFHSFCKGLLSSLQAIARAPFPLATRFPLSRTPRPGTVTVHLDGQPCASDWALRDNPWHVEFVAGGACMPPAGSSFEVRYLPACQ